MISVRQPINTAPSRDVTDVITTHTGDRVLTRTYYVVRLLYIILVPWQYMYIIMFHSVIPYSSGDCLQGKLCCFTNIYANVKAFAADVCGRADKAEVTA